jgi:undecaprenyl diphosphate synthase
VHLIDLTRLPRHIAIIMDGNGRWAERRGMLRPIGHREGSEAVRRTTRASRRLGIDALTLFAFSEQNWERPQFEVDALMELLREFLISERDELMENSIRLRAVGRIDRLPPRVRDVLDRISEETAKNDKMTLTLALSYGGREEIADAARALAERVARGELEASAIDEHLMNSMMPSVDVGQVDLLIRTGGERRISNFLLWGAAYAELYFSDRLWPEYGEEDLHAAIAEFQTRNRRFGRVVPAIEPEPAPAEDVRAHG